MGTGAVIVAAGMSSRMGDFKPMLKVGNISITHRLIHTLQQADASPIVIITGNRAEELEKHVGRLGVICVNNPDYETTQMFDSVKIGLGYIKDKCDSLFFMPVDVPLFTANTLIALMDSNADLAVPVFDGHEGHPLYIKSSLIPSIMSYPGNHGMFGAITECGAEKVRVDVEDRGVLHDVDTSSDYQELLKWHNEQMFRPGITLKLAREEAFFGPGTALLLTLLKSTGSMRLACAEMSLSYSKGWKMINIAERELGFPIVSRRHGGREGGSTTMTEQGEDLLNRFLECERETKELAQAVFDKYFSDLQ